MTATEVSAITQETSLEVSVLTTSPTSSGDESQTATGKMPRHPPAGKPPPFKRHEIDLSAMLSIEQMKQLQVLMIAIMDELQVQIRENFDKMTIHPVEPNEGITPPAAAVLSVPNPGSEKYRSMYGDIGIPIEKPDLEDRDLLLQIMKYRPVNQNTAKPKPILTIPKSPDEATANSKRTETELAKDSLTELKRDALTHFGKWRGLVLKRLHEVVIKNGGTSGNVVRQGPQQPAGNPRRVGSIVRGSSARPAGKFVLCDDRRHASSLNYRTPFYRRFILPHDPKLLIEQSD